MAKEKPHGTPGEIIYLIGVRRGHAWDALRKAVDEASSTPMKHPGITLLLEYLISMAQALELMLKLLSGNWTSHDFAGMHKTVFGKYHHDIELFAYLKTTMTDQKYLLAPVGNLAEYIIELEELYEALDKKVKERYPEWSVGVGVTLSEQFGQYLSERMESFFPMQLPEAASEEEKSSVKAAWEEDIKKRRVSFSEYTKRFGGVRFWRGMAAKTLTLTIYGTDDPRHPHYKPTPDVNGEGSDGPPPPARVAR